MKILQVLQALKHLEMERICWDTKVVCSLKFNKCCFGKVSLILVLWSWYSLSRQSRFLPPWLLSSEAASTQPHNYDLVLAFPARLGEKHPLILLWQQQQRKEGGAVPLKGQGSFLLNVEVRLSFTFNINITSWLLLLRNLSVGCVWMWLHCTKCFVSWSKRRFLLH